MFVVSFAAEDDPADADFDPDSIAPSVGRGNEVIAFTLFWPVQCLCLIMVVF